MAVTVPFHELAGSGSSTHSLDSANSATRFFLVQWADRLTFTEEMAAVVHPSFGATCAVISIDLQPISADMAPSVVIPDPSNTDVQYLLNNGFTCLVTLHYATDFSLAPWPCDIPKPTIPAGSQLVVRQRASTQVIRIPSRLLVVTSVLGIPDAEFVWDPDGTAGRIILPTSEFQLQWYFVDEPPITSWEEDFVGKVNSVPFLGSEAETIFFEGYDVEPSTQFVTSAPFAFTVTVYMRKRRIVDGDEIRGWNHEFHLQGWKRVEMQDSNANLVTRYPLKDFTNMFVEGTCGSSSSSSGP